ncbi:uncharacterized protein LOC134260754 [Saccostrea cucullata]|uniref:uncharacterized protein LOC134260754 n=1 Tax=Saccostrea cuccullata TaxID=36930 RepID=UPI002ED67DCE
MEHHRYCSEKSGDMKYNSPDQKLFLEKFLKGVDIKFDLMCFSCCLAFLQRDRGYICEQKEFENVSYQGINKENITEAELKMPSKPAKNPQIQIEPLEEDKIGLKKGARSVENGRTYQAYHNSIGAMGVIQSGFSRLESIDIRKATSNEVVNLRLSYEDATLVEIHRRLNSIDSLSGGIIKGYLGIKKYTSRPLGKGDIRHYFRPKQEPGQEGLNEQ